MWEKFQKDRTKRAARGGGEAAAARYIEILATEYGCVADRPLTKPTDFDEAAIASMNREELERRFILLQELCWDTRAKLDQLKPCVPVELIKRDPYVLFAIARGLETGQSDVEIAKNVGETKKFVQAQRLHLNRFNPEAKGKPGRPRKQPKTP